MSWYIYIGLDTGSNSISMKFTQVAVLTFDRISWNWAQRSGAKVPYAVPCVTFIRPCVGIFSQHSAFEVFSFHFDFAIMGIFKRFWCVVWDNLYKTMKSMLYWTTKTINVFVHLLCSQYFTSVNSASETALHLPCLAMWLRGARLSSHEAILVLWYRDSKWWDR